MNCFLKMGCSVWLKLAWKITQPLLSLLVLRPTDILSCAFSAARSLARER